MSEGKDEQKAPSWQERLEARLGQLRVEYASGEAQVARYQDALDQLATKMLRIGGAIQVIEEELGAREVE